MNDTVFIEDLRIEAVIGVHSWEREQRQLLRLRLELSHDNRVPAATDRLADTVDYEAVCRRLEEFVGASRFELIETLAERCAELLLREFDLEQVRLTIRKPEALEEADAVGVRIERRAG